MMTVLNQHIFADGFQMMLIDKSIADFAVLFTAGKVSAIAFRSTDLGGSYRLFQQLVAYGERSPLNRHPAWKQ